ncbi:MAG: hypothetical protein MJB57_10265 [Gemmatimonadetes bacterium]|nr:hypothetical protein [Gemmatimonadota bacterium]
MFRRNRFSALSALLPIVLLGACAEAEPGDPPPSAAAPAELPEGAQAISLLGEPLYPAPASAEVAAAQARDLEVARDAYDEDPNDAGAIIWLGRRTAYLGLYREAIEIFTEGIEKHPEDARMYRHRGHRWISVRDLDRAIEDLSHAAELVRGTPDEVEPDGQPNERGIPTSTLQSNIHYHLALAHYLKGDFESALTSYEAYNAVVTNPDQLVAISHWWYAALRRLGRDAEAAAILEPITADLDVIENGSYHRLCLMYKGELDADELWDPTSDNPAGAAVAYGVAAWHLYNGRTDQAESAFRRILENTQWAGFGFIAAEAEIARIEATG